MNPSTAASGDPRDVVGGARDRQDRHAVAALGADLGDPGQERHGAAGPRRRTLRCSPITTPRVWVLPAAQRPRARVRARRTPAGRGGEHLAPGPARRPARAGCRCRTPSSPRRRPRSATCARVTRLEPACESMLPILARVYRYTDADAFLRDRLTWVAYAHARLVRLPAGGARARRPPPARRAPPQLLGRRAARRGVRGRQPRRRPARRAAGARARAAPAALVGGRGDGRRRGRA